VRAAQFGLTEQDVANSLYISLSSSAAVQPNFWLDPQCRMPDYAACIVGRRFRSLFDGDLHRVVLIFRGIVRSFI
jgi:hypothetical protein